jgi:hypothetical protein
LDGFWCLRLRGDAMRRLLACTALLIASAPACLAYHANVEGWELRYFSENAPTGCIMGADFQDGTRLSIIVTTKYEWALGLWNKSWKLTKDGTTDVAAYVDRQFIASGKAAHMDRSIAVLPLTGAAAFRALQTGQRLDLQVPAGNLNFALKGTGKAMYALLDCVKTLVEPRQTASAPREKDFEAVPPAEAAVILTNLLNAGGIQGYRLKPPKQDEAWIGFDLADGTIGFFRAARGLGTRTADDFAGYVISRWSELCKGKFLSGKESIPSVDGSVVRKIVTTCQEQQKNIVTETTIVRQTTGFLLELSHVLPIGSATFNDAGKEDRAALVGATLKMQPAR